MPETRLLVLGIGQELRGDDAAGPQVVRRWQAAHPHTAAQPGLRVETTTLPGLSLLGFLENVSAAILVDAAQSGAQPGTLHVVERQQLAAFEQEAGSAHGWGIAETLAMGEELDADNLPQTLYLLAVESGSFELGEGLSEALQAALPQAVEQLEDLVQSILAGRRPPRQHRQPAAAVP